MMAHTCDFFSSSLHFGLALAVVVTNLNFHNRPLEYRFQIRLRG